MKLGQLLATLAVAAAMAGASTIGTFNVNYRENAGGCIDGYPNNTTPTSGNPYRCSFIAPGPIFLEPGPGSFQLEVLGHGSAGISGISIWSGDATSGHRIQMPGLEVGEVFKFESNSPKIALYYWDWYPWDNPTDISVRVRLATDAATAETPEPGTVWMIVTGIMLVLAGKLKRRTLSLASQFAALTAAACMSLSAQSPPSSLSAVTLSAPSVVGGNSVTGRVTLAESASSPITISLSASLLPPATGTLPVTVPWAVVVPSGNDHVDFKIATFPVSPSVKVRITAIDRRDTTTRSADLVVFESSDPTVKELSLSRTQLTGGESVTGTATLTQTPAFGLKILLRSSNSSVACILDEFGQCSTGEIYVRSGVASQPFTIRTFPVSAPVTVTISATGPGAPSATLAIQPVSNSIKDLFLVDPQVRGGQKTGGLITMENPATKGSPILAPQPQSSRPDLAAVGECSPSVIQEGFSTCQFAINTVPVDVATDVVISATYGGVPRQRTLTLLPPNALRLDVEPETASPFNRGEQFNFTLKVSDANRSPIPGATIAIGNSLCGAPSTVTTDSGGQTVFPCQVPVSSADGAHPITFGPARKAGYTDSGFVTRQILVRAPGTLLLDVRPVDTPPPYNRGDTITFEVNVSDGASPVGEVSINVSNDLCGPSTITTDPFDPNNPVPPKGPSGRVTYTCIIPASASSGAHSITFGPAKKSGYQESGVVTRQALVRSAGTLLLDIQPVTDPPPFGRGDTASFLVGVSDGNQPVANASVSVNNDLCSTSQLTTDINGRATYACMIPNSATTGAHTTTFGPAKKSGYQDSSVVTRQVNVRSAGTLGLVILPFTVPQAQRGQTLSFSATVLDQSDPVSGVSVPISGDLCDSRTVLTDSSGRASYDCTIPNGATGGTHTFSFGPAAKPGYTSSGTVTRQAFVASCTISLSPSSASFSSGASGGSFSVTAPDGCAWSASASAYPWITITRTTSPVTFTVGPNTGTTSRTGFITVSGSGVSQTFSITQAGIPCTLSLSPSSASFSSGASGGSFSVNTPSGCAWSASASGYSWITITRTSSTGVTFTVGPNSSTFARSGYITVYGSASNQTFSITQAGIPCTLSLSPSSASFSSGASGGSFSVNTPSGCSWSASASGYSWITITRTSSTSVTFTVGPNSSTFARSGYITVYGSASNQTFSISQAGIPCTISLSPSSAFFSSGASGGSFSVNTPSGCSWSASASGYSWITITRTSSTGVTFTVGPNSSAFSRTGYITVYGSSSTQSFSVTQAGR